MPATDGLTMKAPRIKTFVQGFVLCERGVYVVCVSLGGDGRSSGLLLSEDLLIFLLHAISQGIQDSLWITYITE